MRTEQIVAKLLNASITGNEFVNEDINDYIYASLSQPPLKIINKNDNNDVMDYTVECSNCGCYVNYGNQIYMRSGYIYCDNKGCLDKLEKRLRNES